MVGIDFKHFCYEPIQFIIWNESVEHIKLHQLRD